MKKRVIAWLSAVLMVLVLLGGCAETEQEPAATEGLTMNVATATLLPGRTQTLKLQVLPAATDLSEAKWQSADENVAIVTGGVVRAVAAGTTAVTATLPNGWSASCNVTVVCGDLMLQNGSFENATSEAWLLGGTAERVADGGYDGTAGVKLSAGSALKQTVANLKPDTEYALSLQVKADEDGETVLRVIQGDAVLGEHTVKLGKNWATRSVKFTAPSDVSVPLELELENAEGVTFCVDNAIVAKTVADADLTVESLVWDGGDGQVTPGTKLTFQATVKNVGTADVTAPFTVRVAFGTETILTLKHEGGLKAGDAVTLTSEPWSAVAGDKMISAHVNPDLAVEESNYAKNNTYQVNLRVAKDRVAPAFNADAVTEAGMLNLTFNDDFDSLQSVDTLASGGVGYKWYVSRQWQQTDMTREDYFVKDGVFTLEHLDSKYAIGASTIDCDTATGYAFNKGYMEVKLRIPEPIKNEGVKSYPAIWSLPPGKWCEISGQNKHWVEMDWLEYYGRDNGYYTITMHEQDYDRDGNLNQYTSTDNARHGLNDQQWHVMGFLWEDDHLRCYLDGELIREQQWSAESYPAPMHQNVDGEIRVDGVFDIFDTQYCMLYLAGTRGMPLEVDYLRVWQKAA